MINSCFLVALKVALKLKLNVILQFFYTLLNAPSMTSPIIIASNCYQPRVKPSRAWKTRAKRVFKSYSNFTFYTESTNYQFKSAEIIEKHPPSPQWLIYYMDIETVSYRWPTSQGNRVIRKNLHNKVIEVIKLFRSAADSNALKNI